MKNLDLHTFPAIDKKQWLKLAEKQMKGADPNTELRWENAAGLNLEAYYDLSDIRNLKYLEDFFLNISTHRWKLYESIDCENAEQANDKVLMALMGGCDGVILKYPKTDELDTILHEVNHEICDINIISNENPKSSKAMNGFQLRERGNCTSSHEVSNPIKQLVELISGINKNHYVYRNAFADFFLEIASVRSLRFLLDSRDHQNVHIHTSIPRHASEEHQWFLNTTAGLASILGGSHSVDFFTTIGDPRISRNTGNLIREESGIEEYSDPCGGSYYIEVLTDMIIKEVKEKLK